MTKYIRKQTYDVKACRCAHKMQMSIIVIEGSKKSQKALLYIMWTNGNEEQRHKTQSRKITYTSLDKIQMSISEGSGN